MRNYVKIFFCLLLFSLVFNDYSFAAIDAQSTLKEINTSLKQRNLSDKDIKLIENSVKELIKEKVDKTLIIKGATHLRQAGMKENDLAFCFQKVNELMSAGSNYVESSNMVKRSLEQAQSKGLKDKEVIKAMTATLKVDKEEIIKNLNLRKKQINQALKDAQAKVNKAKVENKNKSKAKLK